MEFVTVFNGLLQKPTTLKNIFKPLCAFPHPTFHEREVSQRTTHIESFVKEVVENAQITKT